MKFTKDILKKMILSIKMTRQNEIDCDECFEKMSRFAELELAGKSPEKAMPLVQDHLNKCSDCREEYEALLEAIRELKNKA
jgi:predicted anti-sigma-YlaC factor YlaD